ncbi:MAG: hypothetical protein M1831_000926 [Alyxoria varia]|nr:MAG: hypothetical protein M1831_000926 [Alyxoria varia]
MADAMRSLPVGEYPAAMPPPGITPNFTDPPTRAPVVIAVSSFCLVLLWPVFVLTMYTKSFVLKNFGWDDAASIMATLLATVHIAAVIWEMKVLGPHGWDIRLVQMTEQFLGTMIVITQLLSAIAFFFAKSSVFLLYIRAFGPKRWLPILSYIGIAICFATYFGIMIEAVYFCGKRSNETWFRSLSSDRCLHHTKLQNYAFGVFGVVSDLYIFLLPVPAISKLHLSKQKRAGVLAIFATGLVAVVASTMGLYYRVQQATSQGGPDLYWVLPPTFMLGNIELTNGPISKHSAHSPKYTPSNQRNHRQFLDIMALNAGSHNVPGESTGPLTEPPPEPSGDAKDAIIGASEKDGVGQNAPGRDGEKKSKEPGKAVKDKMSPPGKDIDTGGLGCG